MEGRYRYGSGKTEDVVRPCRPHALAAAIGFNILVLAVQDREHKSVALLAWVGLPSVTKGTAYAQPIHASRRPDPNAVAAGNWTNA